MNRGLRNNRRVARPPAALASVALLLVLACDATATVHATLGSGLTAPPGGTVDVPVQIDAAAGVTGYYFVLSFDPALAEAQSVSHEGSAQPRSRTLGIAVAAARTRVPVTTGVNSRDNAGGPIALPVNVISDEPLSTQGTVNAEPDRTVDGALSARDALLKA